MARFTIPDDRGEVRADPSQLVAMDPTIEPRLEAMEATALVFNGQNLDPRVTAIEAVNVATRIAALESALGTAPLGIGEFTVASLPPAVNNKDRFAYATDLFGSVRDKVASVRIGSTWYWVPTRTYAKANVPIGNMTLAALSSPTSMIFNGTLLAAATITLSSANAYPGAPLDIGFDGTISVGTITIAGLLGSATTTLGVGGRKSFRYTDNNDGTFGWKAF